MEFVDMITATDGWQDAARAFAPDLVGISVRNVDEVCITSKGTLLEDLPNLVSECRDFTKGPVVIGGPAVSLFSAEILSMSGADYAIKGEGEHAFAHICHRLARGEKPKADWLLEKGETGREISPAPAGFCTYFDEALRNKIAPYYLEHSRMLNIQTQRGCPLKCCYCTYPALEGRAPRRKPVEAVIEEMRLIKRLGAKYFFVVDGVFNTSRAYVAELCEAIIKADIKLRWCAFLKPAQIDLELAELMARAGLTHAECGSDTLSDSMLKSYGKSFNYEQARQSSLNLIKAGIKICHFIIFGGPGETPDTVRETFERSREIPGSVFFSSTGLRVYPNTPLYNTLIKSRPELSSVSMLEPYYYLSEQFNLESIEQCIADNAQGRSEWILSSGSEEYQREMRRMRAKGKTGPLWDYMELMQRLRGMTQS